MASTVKFVQLSTCYQKPETFRNLLKFTLSMQQPAGPRVYVEYMDFPLNFTDLYWGVRRCNGWQSYMLFSGENQLMKLWSPEAKGSTGGPLLRLERSVQMGGPGFTANFPRPLGLHGWRMDDKWIWWLSSIIIRCHMGMDQYLLIPFLVGWTSIYQLFGCSPGVQGFDTLPYVVIQSTISSFAQVRCGGARMLLGSLAASDRAASHAEGCLAPRCQGHRCQAPGADVMLQRVTKAVR